MLNLTIPLINLGQDFHLLGKTFEWPLKYNSEDHRAQKLSCLFVYREWHFNHKKNGRLERPWYFLIFQNKITPTVAIDLYINADLSLHYHSVIPENALSEICKVLLKFGFWYRKSENGTCDFRTPETEVNIFITTL